MNDLMTKSFLSYVELKKQAMKDLESEPDIEMGKLDPTDEQNLTNFFEEVGAIKTDMEEIVNLLLDLQDLNEESKSTHSAKVLRGLRDRINSDMVTILRKAKNIKARLGSLDQSNIDNRILLVLFFFFDLSMSVFGFLNLFPSVSFSSLIEFVIVFALLAQFSYL
ncbi:unnamed protein product, partial [Vitis vinifera]